MAAEEYESDLEILAPDKEENIEEQNKLLKKAIEQKPDAILFSPSSMDASDELLKEAKKKESVLPILIPIQKKNCRILQLPQIM